MFFEAARLNNATQELANQLDKTDKDLERLEQTITDKEAKGENTANLHVQLQRRTNQYNATIDYMHAVDAYVKALEAKVNDLEETKNELRKLKKHVARVESIVRMSIEDMK